MRIERAGLRIIVSLIVGGIAGFALYWGTRLLLVPSPSGQKLWVLWLHFIATAFLTGPIVATVLAHLPTPKGTKDGHTRCGKCGYILKGLTEPRCSECGERI